MAATNGGARTPATVTEAYPGFGVLLARLSDHRKLGVGGLSRLAGVGEPELRAVFDGGVPSPSLLRRLAPALNLHTADLFLIAGVAVPDELAPLDLNAKMWVSALVGPALRLSSERRRRLRQLVWSLPQEGRAHPVPPLPAYEQYQPGFGALLLGMFRNRNLDRSGAAGALARLTNGHVYLSPSTIGMVGDGRKELTPSLLAGFATGLGIAADDLAALVGIEPPRGAPPQDPAAADVAELIWDVRRLTADQLRQVREKAWSMLQE
jgi:hypothetical protein